MIFYFITFDSLFLLILFECINKYNPYNQKLWDKL